MPSARLSLLLLLAACATPPGPEAGLATIATDELSATVQDLCAPEMDGRLPGTPGYDRAARYAAARFRALGLEPGGTRGYLQPFAIECNRVLAPSTLAITRDGERRTYTLGKDYLWRGFTGAGRVEAPVVFVGYGLRAPGYDDYAGVDVRGKIVLALKQPPKWKIGKSAWGTATQPRPKARTARERGALALILASHPGSGAWGRIIGSVAHGPGEQDTAFPQVHLDRAGVDHLFAGVEGGFAGAVTRIDEAKKPASQVLGASCALEVHTHYRPEAPTANVIARLPGTDPDRWLVIGAHLDHVGRQAGRVVFPGANDNASGCAAVLAVAKAFVRSGSPPRMGVLFVLFSGEEQGLLGAQHFVDHPTIPLDRIQAMFNADCVACGKQLRVGGGKTAKRLYARARALDRSYTKDLVDRTWSGGGADATPFFKKGIPTLYWVTTDTYAHLHQPSDTVDTLNLPLFTRLTRLLWLTAHATAWSDYRNELAPQPE